MKKIIWSLLSVAFALPFVSCSEDAEVTAYLTDDGEKKKKGGKTPKVV